MNGVCLHTATGASVYCLDSAKKWKPMFDPNKVKIQLFQNGTIVYQQDGGENDSRQSLLLKKDASVQRHESESHAKYAEITHGDKVHLLKFRQETECSQFVVKASKFVDMAQPERNIPKSSPSQSNIDGRHYPSTGDSDDPIFHGHHAPPPRQHTREEPALPPSYHYHGDARHDLHYNPEPVGSHRPRYDPDPVRPQDLNQGARDPRFGPSDSRYVADPSGPPESSYHTDPRGPQKPQRALPQEQPKKSPPWEQYPHGYSNAPSLKSYPKAKYDNDAMNKVRENMSQKDIDLWVRELSVAINDKNMEDAMKAVNHLINYTDTVEHIDLQSKCTASKDKPDNEQVIRLNVVVECQHNESHNTSITLKANRRWKIQDLKTKVEQEYYLPRQVQRWMFGKQLVKDNDILEDLVGSAEEARPFMYVVKGKKANLDRHTYENYMNKMGDQQREQADYRVNEPPSTIERGLSLSAGLDRNYGVRRGNSESGRTIPANNAAHKTTALSNLSQPGTREELPQPRKEPPHQRPHPPIFGLDIPVASPSGQNGWPCPTCTLINSPVRPGCEVCSTPRPSNYQLPPGYVPSESERELMRKLDIDDRVSLHVI